MDLSDPVDVTAVEKHPFCCRSFARVNVRHNADVANFATRVQGKKYF
jgi:inactivated superfamily I helicase